LLLLDRLSSTQLALVVTAAGTGSVQAAALRVQPSVVILLGCVVGDHALTLRVTAPASDSTLAHVVRLVEVLAPEHPRGHSRSTHSGTGLE
jgi:hypothetical protein